jgi:phosphatidylglycerol:prolipoprotein diacylglycerol transferase
MHPILFELPLPGGATLGFPAYGTFMVIGMLLANLAGAPRAARIGLRPGQVFDFGLFLVAGGVLGAHWLHVALNPELYFGATGAGWWRALAPWGGGLVYYGGLLGGVAVTWVYARRQGIKPLDMMDYVAPLGALGLASTRVGCFLNGCCWGRPTDLAWGVRFPPGSLPQTSQQALGLVASDSPSLAVHPVQLYEVGAALAIFAALYAAYPGRRYTGQITAWFCLLYACWRLLAETWRADAATWLPGAPWWSLNVYQWLSLGLLVGALVVLTLNRAPRGVTQAADR